MDEISVDVTCQIQGHENKEFCISTSENNTVVGRISLKPCLVGHIKLKI